MKEERLKELLEKYYNGDTSLSEEEDLRKYFSGDDILDGYEAEKEIFSHYSCADVIPVPSADFEERIKKVVYDTEKNKSSISVRKRYIYILSSAAAILLLIGSYFLFFPQPKQEDTFSDPKLAYAETMRILNEVSVKLNKGTQALKPIGKIQIATLTGMRSIDRSAVIISKNLKRIKLFEQISTNENQINIRNNNK
ncbi:MAG: hypothetical protein NTW82_13965 [Bacteroidia bacterium]|nr:hypothetical protein [Bacteroidia bacterium]